MKLEAECRCQKDLAKQNKSHQRVVEARRDRGKYTEEEAELRLGANFAAFGELFEELLEKPCVGPCQRTARSTKRDYKSRLKSRVIDRRRRATRRKATEGTNVRSLHEPVGDDGSLTLEDIVAGNSARPEEIVSLRDDVMQILRAETTETQETILLHAGGFSHSEIADIQGCSPAASRKRVSRFIGAARKKLVA